VWWNLWKQHLHRHVSASSAPPFQAFVQWCHERRRNVDPAESDFLIFLLVKGVSTQIVRNTLKQTTPFLIMANPWRSVRGIPNLPPNSTVYAPVCLLGVPQRVLPFSQHNHFKTLLGPNGFGSRFSTLFRRIWESWICVAAVATCTVLESSSSV